MYKHRRGFPLLILGFLANSLLIAPGTALASTDLKGAVEKQGAEASTTKLSGKAGKSGGLLQGGIKQDASLHPSLKVIPGASDSAKKPFNGRSDNNLFPLGTELIQYRGGVLVSPPPGQLSPCVPMNSRPIGGIIPPISTYQIIPRTGVTEIDPSVQSSTFTTIKGITTYVPGYQAASAPTEHNAASSSISSYDGAKVSTHKGITTYVSGWDVPVVGAAGDQGTPSSQKGVTVFDPGLAVSTVAVNASQIPTSSFSGFSSWTPGYEVYKAPTAEVSIATTRNGITCWAPGYEVSVSTPGLIKNSLGGSWSSTVRDPQGLRATPNSLGPDKIFAQAVVPPPMHATALLLPQLRVSAESLNWDDWYKRVEKAIYSGWQCADVGPGVATVRVTVTKARDVSCEVVDFVPAADVSRNVAAETAFREAALKSVNLMNKFEIPEFPTLGDKQEVTFDVQMKRTVAGPLGPTVVMK
jgi:hypothetical protein